MASQQRTQQPKTIPEHQLLNALNLEDSATARQGRETRAYTAMEDDEEEDPEEEQGEERTSHSASSSSWQESWNKRTPTETSGPRWLKKSKHGWEQTDHNEEEEQWWNDEDDD